MPPLLLCALLGLSGPARPAAPPPFATVPHVQPWTPADGDPTTPAAAPGRGARPARREVGPRDGIATADSLVAAWVDTGRIPGAVLRISREGRLLHERAYGQAQRAVYRDGAYGAAQDGRSAVEHEPLATPLPMTADAVFDLASVTKVMATTFALMLLVDEGAVGLDRPVSTWLPDFTGGGRERITPRHLLTHRSGLPQWWPVYYHAGDPEAAWAWVRSVPLTGSPGAERRYSDLGFMVLGRLVEAVGGARLDRFLEGRLYGPLGLSTTGFRPARGPQPEGQRTVVATSHGNPYEHRMVHDTAFGYRIAGDPDAWSGWRRYTLVGEVNDGNAFHAWGGVAGHAGLFSSAADLDVLLQLLLDGGRSGQTRWIAESTVRAFLSPGPEGQALGWQVPEGLPPGSFAHTGFTGTWVLGVPAQRLSVVLLTNRQHGGVDADGRYPDVGPLQQAVTRALLEGGT
ncbi:MAG: serine hydrolase [Gemmatimonadota bacterium]